MRTAASGCFLAFICCRKSDATALSLVDACVAPVDQVENWYTYINGWNFGKVLVLDVVRNWSFTG